MTCGDLKRCDCSFISPAFFALNLLLASVACTTAKATPTQEEDTLLYGANRYRIAQLPLSEIIKESKAQLSVTASTNNKGYTALWEVQGNVLFLVKFNAEHKGKPVSIDTVIPRAKLPLRAKWFTGNIQLPIGEFNFQTQTWPVIVTLKIIKGKVVEVRASENAKEIATNDGASKNNERAIDRSETTDEKFQHGEGSQEKRPVGTKPSPVG